VVQFLVSNFIGRELVGILASLASIGSLLLHLQRQRQRPRPRHGGRQGPAGGRQAVADGRRVRLESEVGG
jgi:L-lactate permease